MEDVIYGKLEYESKQYSFVLQKNILIIQPPELENAMSSFFNSFSNQNYKPKDAINLSGITSSGYQIIFISIKLKTAGSGCFIAFVPAYAISKANAIQVNEIKGFKTMRFKGECIDNFYSNKKIIKDSGFRKNHKPYLTFNKPKETITKIAMDFGTITFANSWQFSLRPENTAFMFSSYLKINFNKTCSIDDIIEHYTYIHNFFKFINVRSFVNFKEILISIPILFDGKKDNLDFVLNITPPEEKVDFPCKHPFAITYEEISPYFEKIIKLVNEKSFCMYHIPYNKKEEAYVNVSKFLLVASSFESHFDKLYPNYKSNKNIEYRNIKNKVLEFLNQGKSDEKRKNKKYFQTFYNTIEKIEGSLSEKILHTLTEFNTCISEEAIRLLKIYNLQNAKNQDLAVAFEKKRNQIAHGSFNTGFDTLELITYNLIEKIIYIIAFTQVGIPLLEIENLIEKIFRR